MNTPPTVLIVAPSISKEDQAVARINNSLVEMQKAIRVHVAAIATELEKNRDGLKREEVIAALGADRAASLAQAHADLIVFAEKYAPGTFAQA